MPRSIKNKSAKPVGKKGTRKGANNKTPKQKTPKTPKTPKQKTPKSPKTPKQKTPKQKTPKKVKKVKKVKKAKTPNTPPSTPRIEIKKVVDTVEDGPTLAYGHIYSEKCRYCTEMQADWDRVVSNHKHIPLHDIHVVMSNPNDPFQQTIDDFNRRYSLQNAETMLKNQGFPTIFRIRKSNPHDVDYFQEDRTYDSIAQWLSRP